MRKFPPLVEHSYRVWKRGERKRSEIIYELSGLRARRAYARIHNIPITDVLAHLVVKEASVAEGLGSRL